MPGINYKELERILHSGTGSGPAEGCKKVVSIIRKGLETEAIKPENLSLRGLATVFGVYDPYDTDSVGRAMSQAAGQSRLNSEQNLFHEANPTVMTNAFQVLVSELLSTAVIEGHERAEKITDSLVRVLPVSVKGTKIPGVKSGGGALEVDEGHPYEETAIEEKWVTTQEFKNGRILSLTEELIVQDQMGLARMQAMDLGEAVAESIEIARINGITDALTAQGRYVYRPSGVGEALYATDGSNYNYIGSGNTTAGSPYNAAVALQDKTDITAVLNYRWTQVKDDRVDGTQQPLGGLNKPSNILLVPPTLLMDAFDIVNSTQFRKVTNTNNTTLSPNEVAGFVGQVLTSAYMSDANDWYYGDFQRQFIWSEFWPLQTFFQGSDSPSAYEADIAFRIKVRYWGGMTARDSRYVTKIDGA